MNRSVSRLLILAAISLPLSARSAEIPRNMRLETTNGNRFSLESLKGNVVILDFWASWCVPCRTSFPALDALQTKYASRGLKVLGLTLETRDDAIIAFLEKVPVGFTILRDPTGYAGEMLNVVAMPTTFLLDTQGRVVARFEGGDAGVHAKIEAAVVTLLAGGSLPGSADIRVSSSRQATGSVRAWQRTYLADPIMNLDGDALTRILREHVHMSKEGSAGDGGASGGGCGCN